MMISAHSLTLGLIWAPFIHPDVYFEASTLLEGEQKFILLNVDNEQAVTLKCNTEPQVTQSCTAEDLDEAGGAWQEHSPAMLGCPQLALAVEMGKIEVPNPHMVEAKCKTKWPPQGQTAKCKCMPDWSP